MLVEVVGGVMAHSLAIITDAAHLLSDVSGFAVAVLAAFWAKRKSQEHFSYGYHRVEVRSAEEFTAAGPAVAVGSQHLGNGGSALAPQP
jgi:Co/Zn/Cd efflux system component